MFDKESQLWPLLRLIAVVLLSIYGVSTGYKEGWVTRADLPIVINIVCGLVGVDVTQKIAATIKNHKEKKDEQVLGR